MSISIRDLDPKPVWNFFDDITKIPRPSGFEKEIANYIVNFSKNHNLEYQIDAVGNVIVEVPATKDKQNSPLVILQGHMDMVPVAEEGYSHDFKTDPIKTIVEPPFVKAYKTTLGADDGIAIAMCLALVDDTTIAHGPLRLIFTVCEETNMKGALNLDAKYLNADYLINLDSEDNGYLFVNCAGSNDINVRFNFSKIQAENTKSLCFKVSNLSGGHSGCDIQLYRANAIKLVAAIFDDLSDDFDFFIQNIDGGTVRNAIPSTASISVAIPEDKAQDFTNAFISLFDEHKEYYKLTDPNMSYQISQVPSADCLGYAQSLDLIHLLQSLPSGVNRMSDEFESIVETSINLSLVKTQDTFVSIGLMTRSLKAFGLTRVINEVSSQCYLLDNVELDVDNYHEPWSSPSSNRLIDVLNESYLKECGNEFKITGLHAGVECAQFAKLNSKLQLISIGPTVLNPHSPQERVDIEGTKVIFLTLCRALAIL